MKNSRSNLGLPHHSTHVKKCASLYKIISLISNDEASSHSYSGHHEATKRLSKVMMKKKTRACQSKRPSKSNSWLTFKLEVSEAFLSFDFARGDIKHGKHQIVGPFEALFKKKKKSLTDASERDTPKVSDTPTVECCCSAPV